MGNRFTNSERHTLEECLGHLRALDGCEAEFVQTAQHAGGQGRLRLVGPWGELTWHVLTQLRLSAGSMEVAIRQLKELPATEPALLVTDYLPENLGIRLRDSGVDFIDAAGNASLRRPPLYLDFSGRKRLERALRSGRAFQTAGLKLIFLLLRLPQAARWTYRDLAQKSGIALGAVGPILRELEQLGFLQPGPGNRRIAVTMDDLLLRWELGYSERLRAALHVQPCRLADNLRVAELPELIVRLGLERQVLLGGELGAARLLQHSAATQASLHYTDDALRTMLRLQLIPDPQGPVQLISRFGTTDHWQGEQPAGARIIDPLLLHAELLATGSDQTELLQQLHSRYLAPRFKEPRPD
jgi:hypothetical protein